MTTTETRPAAVRRGHVAEREGHAATHGYGSPSERHYQALVKPDERSGRGVPTRSGGARHHVLNEMQFRSAGQRKARQAGS